MATLVAHDITKRYGDRTVLAGVNLRLRSGGVTLVGGRSGSGKSTLFAILAALEAPTSGTVLLDDEPMTGRDPDACARLRVAKMGIVFQDFRLLPDLTVLENVRLPLILAGRRRGSQDRAAALLGQVGLADHTDAFPETLSGGEQQRVAVARAMANDPAVVLADEPTANLDEENAHRVLALLRGAAVGGRIVLVVSHDPIAREYADAWAELKNARLPPLQPTRAPAAR